MVREQVLNVGRNATAPTVMTREICLQLAEKRGISGKECYPLTGASKRELGDMDAVEF